MLPTTWDSNGRKRILDTCIPNINVTENGEFEVNSESETVILGFNLFNKPGVEFLAKNLHDAFPDLIAMQVYSCRVSSIGNHLKGLSKLKHATLARNEIENIADDAFVDLVSLEYLSLSFNKIKFLTESMFNSLEKLKDLLLNNNKMQVLHHMLFSSLSSARNINLGQNRISTVPENIFENLTSLKNLSLFANKLEMLQVHLLKNNLKMEYIWFNTNNINVVDSNMFSHLPNLNYVDFQNNLCLDKWYNKNNLDELRMDLKLKCNGNSSTESAESTTEVPSQNAAAEKRQIPLQSSANG